MEKSAKRIEILCRSTLHIVGEQVLAEIENCNQQIIHIENVINQLKKQHIRFVNLKLCFDQEVELSAEEAITVLTMASNRWKKQLDKKLLHRHKVIKT